MDEIETPKQDGLLFILAQSLGASEPAVRLLFTVLLGYPIALIHRYYFYGKPPVIQHVFFTITGFALGYYNFGTDILHTTANLLVVYVILKLIGGTLLSTLVVLSFNMGYLLIGYYVTQTDTYDIVWTMPHCILVLRLSGLAFDLYDGQKPVETLSKDGKKIALKEMPSLLEMAAYTYFPTSFLVGPQYPFRRYQDYIAGKFGSSQNEKLDCVGAALSRALLGFLYLMCYTIGSLYYTDSYLLGEDYSELSFPRRCWILGVWAHITLYKYVSCWLICEGSCILTGITYNGKDEEGNEKWDGCANINVAIFEGASNFSKDYINSFNINTNFWVFQYIYKRLKFLGNKHYSQLGVLIFLSVWHGLHSGYYMSFFMEFVSVAMEKDFEVILQRNKVFLEFLSKPGVAELKWVFLKLYTHMLMGPCVAPLALLSFSKWWHVHKNVYFYTHFVWVLWPVYRPLVKKLLPSAKEPKERKD